MDFVVFLHISFSILIFGGLTTAGVLAVTLGRARREVALPALHWAATAEKLLGPATLVVPILGVWLVSSEDVFKFSQAWVWLSLVLYVIAVALGPGVAAGIEKRAVAKLEAAPEGATGASVIGAELQQLATVAAVLTALLLVIVALMVYRPGL